MIYQWKLYKGPPQVPWHVTNLSANCCSNRLAWLKPYLMQISILDTVPFQQKVPRNFNGCCETYLLHLLVWHIKCLLLILIFRVMCKKSSLDSLVSAGSCSAPPHLWYFVRGPGNLNRCLVFCKPDMPKAAVLQQAPWLLKVQRPSFSKSGDPSDLIRFPKLFV